MRRERWTRHRACAGNQRRIPRTRADQEDRAGDDDARAGPARASRARRRDRRWRRPAAGREPRAPATRELARGRAARGDARVVQMIRAIRARSREHARLLVAHRRRNQRGAVPADARADRTPSARPGRVVRRIEQDVGAMRARRSSRAGHRASAGRSASPPGRPRCPTRRASRAGAAPRPRWPSDGGRPAPAARRTTPCAPRS